MATFQTPVDIQAALTVDGPVGIGTAEPAQKLSVAGIIESTSGGIKFPDGSIQATAVSGAANADGHSLDTADGSQADVVFVNNKGNVGIGTTNPGAKLHVAGDLRVSGAKLELNSGGADAAAVLGVSTPGAQDFVSLSGGSNSQSPRLVWRHGALRFGTATSFGGQAWSEKMRISDTGNVGIGTATPRARLEVAGDTILGGNVGIGTTEPYARLSVRGIGGTALTLESPTGSARNFALQISGLKYGDFAIVQSNAHEGNPLSDGTTALYIAPGLNVGIGTTEPRAGLEVAGDTILGGNVGIGLNPEANRKFQVHSTNANERITLSGNYSGKNQNSDSPKLTFAGQYQTAGVSIQGINVTGYGLKRMAFFTHNAQDYTSESEVMSITPAGNVGIGTTEPVSKLTVGAVPASFAAYGVPRGQYLPTLSTKANPATEIALTLLSDGVEENNPVYLDFIREFRPRQFNWMARIKVAPEQPWTIDAATRNSALVFETSLKGVPSEKVRITSDGNVHASRFVSTSDLRLKTNVAPLSGVLEKLAGLQAVSFDWNERDQSHDDSSGQRQLGLVAQDVEAVFPELVASSGEEGYKAVDYGRLTAVLVEAVRELRAENATLRERTEVLEKATAER